MKALSTDESRGYPEVNIMKYVFSEDKGED